MSREYYANSRPAVELALGMLIEPIDWLFTVKEIYNDPYNPWSYAGLIPIVPAGVGKLGKGIDKAGDIAKNSNEVCDTLKHAPSAAELRPYGGPGGGHHLPAKSGFAGAPGYNANQALAIPNAELARLGVRHELVTGAQMTGYRAFGQTGATLTWEAMQHIETQALIRGGMNAAQARATVQQAIQALRNAGVSGPTRIPWGG